MQHAAPRAAPATRPVKQHQPEPAVQSAAIQPQGTQYMQQQAAAAGFVSGVVPAMDRHLQQVNPYGGIVSPHVLSPSAHQYQPDQLSLLGNIHGYPGATTAAPDPGLDYLSSLSLQELPSASFALPAAPATMFLPQDQVAADLLGSSPFPASLAAIWGDAGPQPQQQAQALSQPLAVLPSFTGSTGGQLEEPYVYQPFGGSSIWGTPPQALTSAGSVSFAEIPFLGSGLGSLGWSLQTDPAGQAHRTEGHHGQTRIF